MWNTLRAESGGRWCQPHPCSMELLTIGELMRNMERRSVDAVEAKPEQPQQLKAKIAAIIKLMESVGCHQDGISPATSKKIIESLRQEQSQ